MHTKMIKVMLYSNDESHDLLNYQDHDLGHFGVYNSLSLLR